MKKLLLTTFATSALLLAGCQDKGAEVASTEAGRIREEDLYEQMKREPLQNGMTVGETVLQKMLMEAVFEKAYGDAVTDEDVEAAFAESAASFGSVEDYEALLEMQGVSPDYVRENVRLSLLIREAVADNVEIEDEQIAEAYEAGQSDFTAQHILVADAETANEVIEKLNDGADFGELVTEYSTDPGSLQTEGTYSFNEGEMVPEFEDAVRELEAGATTAEPVESDHGFHVIRRLEAPSLEEQREDIESMLLDTYTQNQEFMNGLIIELAADANVQIADEDLLGAWAAYTPQPEIPAAEEDEETEEPADEDATEEPVEEETEEPAAEDDAE